MAALSGFTGTARTFGTPRGITRPGEEHRQKMGGWQWPKPAGREHKRGLPI